MDLVQENTPSSAVSKEEATKTSENVFPIPQHIEDFLAKCSPFIDTVEESREILGNQSLYTNSALVQLTKKYTHFNFLLSNMFIFFDPPKHTPIRADVRKIFQPIIASPDTEAKVNEIVKELVANIEKKNGEYFDFMEEFGRALPIKLLSGLLGIDIYNEKNWSTFLKWMRAVSSIFEIDPATLKKNISQVDADSEDTIDWLKEIVTTKSYSSDGLINTLVEAKLGEAELLGMASLLLFAGQETTSSLLGNMIYALGLFPNVYEDLRQNPSLITNTVEETLRMFPSFPVLRKIMVKDHECQTGRVLKKGSFATIAVVKANRSPVHFSNPDVFDIHRTPKPQILTFSHGIHMCMGRELVRLEAKVALTHITAKFKEISFNPTQPREWKNTPLSITPGSFQIRMR